MEWNSISLKEYLDLCEHRQPKSIYIRSTLGSYMRHRFFVSDDCKFLRHISPEITEVFELCA